ncbi:type II CAAX endopeptidase family protein [Riemerella anatipestifer]|nr:type II CAAX endopeptidase family protein [Riemerella anatipestifer]
MNKRFIIGILLTIFGYLLITTKFFGLANFQIEKSTSLLLSRIEFWILLIGMLFFAKSYEKSKFLLINEEKKKWWIYPVATFALLLVVTLTMSLISIAVNKIGIESSTKTEETLYRIVCENKFLLFFTCITAAVTEELLFRGYILSRIKKISNSSWISVFVSALLFGLAHFGYNDFRSMFFPFIIGLIFGGFYVRYRSISILIISHFIIDVYSLYSQC